MKADQPAEQPADQPADQPPATLTVNGPKLVRLEYTIRSLIEEMREAAPSSEDLADVGGVLDRLLAEVGSCLPDPLLEELARLVGPLGDGPVDGDTLRVVLAQLDGWLAALVAEALTAATEGQVAVT